MPVSLGAFKRPISYKAKKEGTPYRLWEGVTKEVGTQMKQTAAPDDVHFYHDFHVCDNGNLYGTAMYHSYTETSVISYSQGFIIEISGVTRKTAAGYFFYYKKAMLQVWENSVTVSSTRTSSVDTLTFSCSGEPPGFPSIIAANAFNAGNNFTPKQISIGDFADEFSVLLVRIMRLVNAGKIKYQPVLQA